MKYKELQQELKARGLSAYGKKVDLEKRLSDNSVPKLKDIERPSERSFVFTGDPNTKNADGTPRDTNDPGWFYMHGYQFHLNGKPTKVTDDVAVKLATHSHFTEK